MTEVTLLISTDNEMEAKRAAFLLAQSSSIHAGDIGELIRDGDSYKLTIRLAENYSVDEEEQ